MGEGGALDTKGTSACYFSRAHAYYPNRIVFFASTTSTNARNKLKINAKHSGGKTNVASTTYINLHSGTSERKHR